jgi:hypothetical protein
MLANAGTPWMWFEASYVTLANVGLGLLEGVLIAAVWRVPFGRCILVMLIANFASSLAGAGLLSLAAFADITIVNVHAWLWGSLVALFLLTLLVELPFVGYALSHTWRGAVCRRAARATLTVHAISYPLMIVLGWAAGGLNLLTDWSVVPVEKLAQPGTLVVFYLDRTGTQVLRRDLVAGGDVVVGTLVPRVDNGPLFLQSQREGSSSLHVWREGEDSETVATGLQGLEVTAAERTRSEARLAAPALAPQSPWRFETSFYHALVCEGPGQRRVLHAHTVFVKWCRET